MKRTLILMVIALSLFAIAGCSTATAEQPREYTFTYVHDWSEPKEPQGAVRIMQEMNDRANETAQDATTEEEVAPIPVYEESGSYSGYNESLNNNPAYINCGNSYGNSFYSDGVAYVGDREFNWYSQNVMPGGGLDELNANGRHVDESTGFVVDGDGYIAVASPWGRDKVGTVVDTPYGQGKVYDANEGDAYDLYTDF